MPHMKMAAYGTAPTHSRADAGLAQLMAQRRQAFEQILDRGERHAAAGRLELAARHAQVAARYAHMDHCGLFASPRLERLAIDIGARAVRDNSPVRAAISPADVSSILHVFTLAHAGGGMPRSASRWMRLDASRRHSIAVVDAGPGPVMPVLADAVGDSGGTLHALGDAARGLIDRAQSLRELSHRFDLVVLWTNHFDVVPLLAFGHTPENRVPVALSNHSDHVFWAGVAAAGAFAHLRESGRQLSITRRGVDEPAAFLVPLGLTPVEPPTAAARKEARTALGIPSDGVVLTSATDAYKLQPIRSGPGLLEVLLPIVESEQSVHVLLMGPGEAPEIMAIEAATDGRLRALGHVDRPGDIFAAADIYLDPCFPSIGSLLEAAQFGLPVMRLSAGTTGPACVFEADPPGLEEVITVGSEPGDYREKLLRLVKDPAERERQSRQILAAVHHTHDPERWRTYIEPVYAAACSRRPGLAPQADLGEPNDLDLDVARFYHRFGFDEWFVQELAEECAPLGRLMGSRLWSSVIGVLVRNRVFSARSLARGARAWVSTLR
jgi:hypothetical protein